MKIVRSLLLTLILISAQTGAALGDDVRYGAEVSETLVVQNNYIEYETSDFDYDETYNVVAVSPFLSVSRGGNFDAYILADMYWIHSFTGEPDESGIELENMFASYSTGKLWGSAGLQPFSFGRGFVLDDNEPGLSLEYDLKDSLYLTMDAARVIDSSSMLSFGVGIVPGYFEKIEVFAIYFSDKDNAISAALNDYLDLVIDDSQEAVRPDASSGEIYWIGAGGELFLFDCFVTGTVLLQHGDVEVSSLEEEAVRQYKTPSFLFDIEVSYSVTDAISTSGFLFYMNGGKVGSLDDELNVFIAPLPMNTRTTIFLNEKLGVGESDDGVSVRGVTPAGVVAPGIKLDTLPGEKLSLQLVSALLFPETKPTGSQSFYGWETDIFFSYDYKDNVTCYLDAGLFVHGDFYKDGKGGSPPPASRFSAGVNLFF